MDLGRREESGLVLGKFEAGHRVHKKVTLNLEKWESGWRVVK